MRNAELEHAILRDPEAPDAYLVYSDWLQRQGDPRGELIAVQHAALHAQDRSEAYRLSRQADALLDEHLETLLGEKLVAAVEGEELTLDWHLGHIRGARVGQRDYSTELGGPAVVAALLACPSALVLRELTVGMVPVKGYNSYEPIIEAIARAGGPRTLRSLFLGDYAYPDDWPISFTRVGDLSPLYPVCPHLRSVRLRGGGVELGSLHLPELRELTVETGALPVAVVRSLSRATLPELERLELWFGQRHHRAEVEAEDLQPLLLGTGLPKLRKLGLRNAEFSAALCRMLPRAAVLPRLQELDLSLGTMTDEDAAVLAANAPAFGHLERLDVHDNMLTAEGEQRVAGLCAEVRYQPQREHDEDGTGYRYAAVGE